MICKPARRRLSADAGSAPEARESRACRLGSEVVLSLERTRLHQETVGDAGFQWVGLGATNLGAHTANRFAVIEIFNRHGVGIGYQVPGRMREFAGFDFADGEDFERREPEFVVEGKDQRDYSRIIRSVAAVAKMNYLNIVPVEPVFVKVKR